MSWLIVGIALFIVSHSLGRVASAWRFGAVVSIGFARFLHGRLIGVRPF